MTQEVVQGINIARKSRHHAADRVAIEKRKRQPLEVPKDSIAQVEHDTLTDILHVIVLHVPEKETAAKDSKVQREERSQAGRVVRRYILIDGNLRQPWSDQIEHSRNKEQKNGNDKADSIGVEVRIQSAHEPAVVNPSTYLVVF